MKALVAYFSASAGEVTKKAAQRLAQAAKADIFEIRPVTPYTKEDLNWRDIKSRSSVEMTHPEQRPPLAEKPGSIADYDVVFLGFPIWWHRAPTIINTFLESCDFAGKTVAAFATSGSEGFGKTLETLTPSCDGSVRWTEGKMLTRATDEEIAEYVKSVK